MAVESDQELHALEAALETRTKERDKLWTELEAAKESLESQSAIFTRELKIVSKHRDEALAAADSARANLQEKAAILARERVALEAAHDEAKAKTERELGRLRRERDVLLQQRDDLRERIGKMVGEQNKLIDELAVNSGVSSRKRAEGPSVPVAPDEGDVIDLPDAEVVKDLAFHPRPSGVRPPRIRPVATPPPNVRVL
jgi:hypothetical protein